jgi:hypothetical protein
MKHDCEECVLACLWGVGILYGILSMHYLLLLNMTLYVRKMYITQEGYVVDIFIISEYK